MEARRRGKTGGERDSGSVQLCERIKQSLLCQRLNTPAEDIKYSQCKKTPISVVKSSLCFLVGSTRTAHFHHLCFRNTQTQQMRILKRHTNIQSQSHMLLDRSNMQSAESSIRAASVFGEADS